LKNKLLAKVRELPEKPGIYLFKNKKGEIIYIGKAKKLRKRVSSYFRASTHEQNGKTRELYQEIDDLEFIVVPTEKEALLLEANLIYQHKPKFNVLLKDSKRYPYIFISDDEFPYISITRIRDRKGFYYGPYTSITLVRNLLDLLQRIFKLRSCMDNRDCKKGRPCFLYHLKMCSAPLAGEISHAEYQKQVRGFMDFLDGKTLDVRRQLERSMQRLAENLQFEKAKEIRDVLVSFDRLYSKQAVDVSESYTADFIVLDSGIVTLLEVRGGLLLGKLTFDFPEGNLKDFIQQFYYGQNHRKPPVLIVPGLNKSEIKEIAEDFEYIGNPRSEEEKRLLLIASDNTIEELRIRLKVQQSLKMAKELLGLNKIPRIIEGVDISHTQGVYTVASVVVFRNGQPDKMSYRRYRITELNEPNDFEALKILMRRRYSKHPPPDLLLVDGGAPQLAAVRESLEELGLKKIDFIGLAKEEEEIVFPDNRGRLKLSPDHPVLRLLTTIRDESHRFAVNYHRVLRERKFSTSRLDDIPGIGPKRKRALVRAFGSVTNIKKASKEELMKVIKNRKVVEQILAWTKKQG